MSRHLNTMKGHSNLVERLRKSLYYGSIKCGSHERIDYPSMPLTEVTVELFDKTVTSGPKGLDVFDMNFAAQVSRQACITPTSIMLSMIYLERLKAKSPEYLRRVSTCDLFLVSIMIASKFLFDDGEDDEVFNDEWAASANIDVKQLNRLEREFLKAINWSLFVDCHTFMKQLSKVEALISLNESSKRMSTGMTYTELLALFNYSMARSKGDPLWTVVTKYVTKVLLVSSMAYWVTVLALIGSTAIAITSLERTQILVNQTLVTNDSMVGLNGSPMVSNYVSQWNSHELGLSLCDVKNAKIENIVYIRNRIPYRKRTPNTRISSDLKLSKLPFDSMPKIYNSLNNYKY